jgi:hypothetical protein
MAFLMTSTAGAAALMRSSALASPKDTVRVTCVDVHGRARARSGPTPNAQHGDCSNSKLQHLQKFVKEVGTAKVRQAPMTGDLEISQ